MTHAQWQTQLRRNLALVDRDPPRALKGFDVLLSELDSDRKKAVGEWHIDQTLEALSIVHSHLEDHRQSAETMRQLAVRHAEQLNYYRRAFVAAAATAAMEFAYAGNRAEALRALRSAARAAAGLRPPEKLFAMARKVVQGMPRRRGPAG